ncbi:MAG: acetyltransferase [Verrucomicrobiota bacterium]
MKRLIIVGAGGFGREVYAWAKDHKDCGTLWEVVGFLDDDPFALNAFEYPVGILGSIDTYVIGPDDIFLCAIGSPKVKKVVVGRMLARGADFMTLVHPTVVVGENVMIAVGTIVCPGAVITCDITIGRFVAVNCLSSIGHDVKVGDWATISGHCDLTGKSSIGEGSFLGSGSRILPGKSVGSEALVGAGSVVLNSVSDGKKVFGNPAQPFS